MTFADYLLVLRTYWKSVLVCTILGAALGAAVAWSLTPVYSATAQVLFTADLEDSDGQDLALSANYVQSRMITYDALVDTPRVLESVIAAADLDDDFESLGTRVDAEYQPSSTLLSITYRDESAAQAASVATTIAASLSQLVDEIERPNPAVAADSDPSEDDQMPSNVRSRIVSEPGVPEDPTSPNTRFLVLAGTMAALTLGLLQAGIRSIRSGTIGSKRHAQSPSPENA